MDRVYTKYIKGQLFKNGLVKVQGVDEKWVTDRILHKGKGEVIILTHIKQLMKNHPDEWKVTNLFALGIYGIVIFPKTLGYIKAAVVELFEQLTNITYNPLEKFLTQKWREDIPNEKWVNVFIHLQDKDIIWRALWLTYSDILYQCGDSINIMLLGLWGGVGYSPLLAIWQYGARQFVPVTHEIFGSEFAYHEENYKKKVKDVVELWKKIFRTDVVASKDMLTPDYIKCRKLRKNEIVPIPDHEDTRTMEEHLKPVPSELEIAKKEFEAEKEKLKQRLMELEAEKFQWKLDADTQKDREDMLEKEYKNVFFELEDLRTGYQEQV
ncbi:uncharacterized protein LOC120168855 [Hibiscus syriacus]|uniref:uncharacterized protein LOC120168855 n=1 Tax=Hibiscus syriacus TaxID=106335 RepID=UPI001921E128|nr:uncharacterized protein LOC120168855 [Hibiscus syriacus]